MIPLTKQSLLILLASLCVVLKLQASPGTVNQTQNKIKQLDNQISQLKKTLASVHDKRSVLNQELAETEKTIGKVVQKLHDIQSSMAEKQLKIDKLRGQLSELNSQLSTQQGLLANHIRTRYKMGEYQPLKWLINQDEPYTVSRLLTFHQYLVRSRQNIIDKIDETRSHISSNHDRLNSELTAQQDLKTRLNSHQIELEHSKQYHKEVIQTLNQEISSKEQTLQEFERNKENLSRLLKELARQSMAQPKRPFANLRRKLPKPVHNNFTSMKKMSQGIAFFAKEGTAVYAVNAGKVVFSDWLNGYGLLLIIDHGQGFMTLYAHNQSLFVQKGKFVAAGEQVAAVGHSGGLKQNGLYFEVRHRGKAVPPLDWLS